MRPEPETFQTPGERYAADLRRPDFAPDQAQRHAVKKLDSLYDALVAEREKRQSITYRIKRVFGIGDTPGPVKGLYLWGGVGRGKTYLMDCFYNTLPFREKRRSHFHRFMNFVHDQLAELNDHRDPLEKVARRVADETMVICFDEFFVSDIADAMILGTLFEHLFEYGVTLVATSNVKPDNLYRDGLQRARFLPAIALLNKHTEVINVDGGVDYRLRVLERAEIYHSPLDSEADTSLRYGFEHIAESWSDNTSLTIEGRTIDTVRLAEGVAWFDFESICNGPRSKDDYMEISRLFHTVVVSNVPILDSTMENAARRFISMIDEFYDRSVKLMVSAEEKPESLYQGRKLRFEFERTRSRLQEMQSHEYLAREHKP